MANPLALLAGLGLISALASCTSTDPVLRVEGVTSYAGDAIAANTVLQMVDPWPVEARETHLRVPAERPAPAASAEAGPGSSAITP